jgi:hypothetical protein
MNKANYIVIHVNSIEECLDTARLTRQVKSILTQANGFALHGTRPEVEAWLKSDGNMMKVISAIMTKLKETQDDSAQR